jgi:hypothetical protein
MQFAKIKGNSKIYITKFNFFHVHTSDLACVILLRIHLYHQKSKLLAQATSQKERDHQTPDYNGNCAQSEICCHSYTVKGTEYFGEICPISGENPEVNYIDITKNTDIGSRMFLGTLARLV